MRHTYAPRVQMVFTHGLPHPKFTAPQPRRNADCYASPAYLQKGQCILTQGASGYATGERGCRSRCLIGEAIGTARGESVYATASSVSVVTWYYCHRSNGGLRLSRGCSSPCQPRVGRASCTPDTN